jgi:hypothetical protein
MKYSDLLKEVLKQKSPHDDSELLKSVAYSKAARFKKLDGDLLDRKRAVYISEIFDHSRRIQINAAALENRKNKPKILFSDQDIFTSDYLAEKVRPWAEKVRQEIFGSRQAPFDGDLWAGIEWIEQTSKEPLPVDLQEKVDKFNKIFYEVNALQEKGEILGSVTWKNETLDYPGRDGWSHSVVVRKKTDLYKLSEAARGISSATGFSNISVIPFILSGIAPLIPRASIAPLFNWSELPAGGSIRRTYISIEINAADFTFDELKAVYDHYRASLKVKKQRPLDDEQIALFDLVAAKGGPPLEGKGTVEFWNEILKVWNTMPGNKPVGKWESLYKRYARVMQKMNNIFKAN